MTYNETEAFWNALYNKYAQQRAAVTAKKGSNGFFALMMVLGFFTGAFPLIVLGFIFLMVRRESANKIQTAGNNRFLAYIRVLRSRRVYVGYDTLARSAGVSTQTVRQDLSAMMLRGELPGATLDDEHGCIYLNTLDPEAAPPEATAPIVQGPVAKVVQKAVEKADSAARTYPPTAMSVPLETPLKEAGAFYLGRLADLKSQADSELAPKISELRQHLNKLITYGSRHPNNEKDVQTFLYRYLPSALKLITAGVDFSAFSNVSSEIAQTRLNIIGVLSTLQTACDRQLEQFYQSDVMDLSSDITVLENMLSQEGLIPGEYEMPLPQEKKE